MGENSCQLQPDKHGVKVHPYVNSCTEAHSTYLLLIAMPREGIQNYSWSVDEWIPAADFPALYTGNNHYMEVLRDLARSL